MFYAPNEAALLCASSLATKDELVVEVDDCFEQ